VSWRCKRQTWSPEMGMGLVGSQMSEPLVLVAHDSEALRGEIHAALYEASVRLADAHDGDQALHRLVRRPPAVLVVDVGISGRAAFELCDAIRDAGLGTRVLLVASVYNRTRYKRRPTSLYGADDYVEQHHIHDMLRPKVERLLGRPVDVPAWGGEVDPAAAKRVQAAGDQMLSIRFSSPEEGRHRAQRLCELLVADMALYNGDELALVAAGGEAPARLLEDLDEVRRVFERLVPLEVRGAEDWIGRAYESLVRSRRRASSGAMQATERPDSSSEGLGIGDDRG